MWIHVESLGNTPRPLSPGICSLAWDLVRLSSLLSRGLTRQRALLAVGRVAPAVLWLCECTGEGAGRLTALLLPCKKGVWDWGLPPTWLPPALSRAPLPHHPIPAQVTAVCFAAGGRSRWSSYVETGVHSNVTTPRCSRVAGEDGRPAVWGWEVLSRRDGAWRLF